MSYGKRPDLLVHEEEPFNAETGLAALAQGVLTATDAFYVRGHGAVPQIDSAAWRLRVHGLVERELDLSLTTLREAFRERTETATLQCAGNRRAGLIAIRDIAGEAPWGPGATGTATWSGVARSSMRSSHLTLRAPMYPGTTTRTGAPCTGGSGSPFIDQASSTSGRHAFSSGTEPPKRCAGSAPRRCRRP